MSVAAAARLKYPPSTTFANTELEFYAVSCVAWPDLCNAYHIEAYPSVYAYPANAAATNESKIDVGSMFFSLTKVERALQLSASSSSASIFPTDTISTSTTPQSNQRQLQDTDDRGGTDDKDSKKPNNDNTNGQRPNDDNEKGPKEEDDRADDNDQEKGDNNKEEEEAEDFEFHRARTNHAAIPMRAGAAFAKSKPRTMDQWKEEQQKVLVKRQQDDGENPSQRRWARKTPRMRQKQKLLQQQQQHEWDKARSRDPDGATPIMLAHRNGTLEFKTRESDRLAALKRMKQSRRPRRQRDSKTVATGVVSVSTNTTISFQKKISSPGFAEHLPLVKRMVQQQMTTEEELILDASLSFLEGLRVGLQRKQRPLDWGQTQTLRDWLQLMRISLPPEWALLGTIDALIGSLDQISQNVKAINKILKKFKVPRKEWSKSCSPEHGFSCGFWKLLHVMTVGMAEHRGGQDLIDSGIFKPSTRVFSPDEAARTLRQYMLHFFPCDACAQHFVAMYDQCDKHRRCDRLTTATTTASDADWKELAKWLWEVHNSVSVNVLNEKIDTKRKKKQRSLIKKAPAGPGVASREEQIEVLWPAVDDCMECFKQDGSYDENAVFVHLEATYW